MSEPVLLIPGMMQDARGLLPQLVGLAAGRMLTLAVPTPGSIEEISARLLAGAPAKFAVIGAGLGGAVALDIVRRAAERVTRVALISTDPLAEAPQVAAAREARMIAARSGRLAEAMRDEVPASALAATEWRGEVLDLVQDMARGLGAEVFVAQSRSLQRRPDQQKTLRRALVPALIIAGVADTVVPMRRQEFVAELMPYGQILRIEDAGHLPQLEQPQVVNEALEAFLNGPMLLR